MAYKLALGKVNCTTELTGPTLTLGLATPLSSTHALNQHCCDSPVVLGNLLDNVLVQCSI